MLKIVKWAFVFGGSFGVILLLGGIADYTIGYHGESDLLSSLNYCFRIVGLIICLIIYRNSVLHKNITFNQAFWFGFFTFFFAMLIVDACICVVFNYYPELLAAKVEIIKARLVSFGVSEEQIQSDIVSALWIKNPFYVALSFMIWVTFIGPFVSLISAVLLMASPAHRRLKRRRKTKVEEKTDEPSISKLLLTSRPEFDPNNIDNKMNE